MKIELSQIQELRSLTGCGVMDCKRALEQVGGDFDKARAALSEKAEKTAAKKATREAHSGVIEAYIHGNGRIGVLLEVHCETDFLSQSADFRSLVRDLALQIASEAPVYISAEEVPNEIIEEIAVKAAEEARALGKPEKVIEQFKTGRVKKYLKQACLIEQAFIKNQDITIGSLVNEFIAKSGENIKIKNFVRYELPKSDLCGDLGAARLAAMQAGR